MLIDANEIREDIATDICIIGAGPAGIALAVHFRRKGIDTVVLAGGGEKQDINHRELAATVQTGIATDDTRDGNVRAFGGTSHGWGGYCLKMEASDFERRPWVPNSGWPISLSDIEPYYDKAAQLCTLDDADFDPANQLLPEQATRGELLKNPILRNLVIHVKALRFGQHYREELQTGDATRVCLNGIAVEFDATENGEHVTAVRCRTLGGNSFRVRANQFVLAAGAIENARLLLLSRNSNPQGLANHHDVVGRYFMQHPVFRHGWLLVTNQGSLEVLGRGGRPGIGIASSLTPAVQEQHKLPSCHFLLGASDYTLDREPDWPRRARQVWWRFGRLHLQSFRRHRRQQLMVWNLSGNTSLDATSLNQLNLRAEQVPDPLSRITLSEERDAFGSHRAAMNWRLSELDFEFADRCLSLIGCAAASEGLGRVQFTAGGARQQAGGHLHGGYHYYGTTRMHDDPKFGVVDKNCRVHGIGNLYIAGSSVFTTAGYANPTFTIVALALRLAEHLEERVRAKPTSRVPAP